MKTLAHLDTLIAVSPENFPRDGSYAARRAVSRLAQAAGADPATVPLADALERYEAMRDRLSVRAFRDERIYLRRALSLTPLPDDVLDRIRLGTPTMADAVEALKRQPKAADNGRGIGALQRFAEHLGIGPAQIPATEAFIERHLEALSPPMLGMTPANFGNWKSRVRRAVRLVDLQARQQLSLDQMAGPWRTLLAPLAKPSKGTADLRTPEQRKAAANLPKAWPLVTYAYRHGIAPDAVDDSTVQAALAALRSRARVDSFNTMRNAVYAWERLQKLLDTFPKRPLSRLYASGNPRAFAIGFDQLPQRLRSSWQTYRERFFGENGMPASFADLIEDEDDPEDTLDFRGIESETPIRRKTSGATIFRTIITYAANAAIAAGENPSSVSELATPASLQRTLQTIYRRQRECGKNEPRNQYLYAAATILISIAKDLGASEHELEMMKRIRDRVDPHFIRLATSKRTGKTVRIRQDWRIGPRHAERLRAFNNPAVVDAWFSLPDLLIDRAQKVVAAGRTPTLADINDVIVAILHLLDRCGPMRRHNKATLRFRGKHAHLTLPDQEGVEGRLHVPAEETKNWKAIDLVLPPDLVSLLKFYLSRFRPVLAAAVGADPENPYLFPSKGMAHRSGTVLNKIFVDRNWRFGGFKLNMHCQRHVCAKLILDADPSKMGLVQQLLGHRSRATTEAYYGQINQIIAQRWYQDLLAQRRAARYGADREAA